MLLLFNIPKIVVNLKEFKEYNIQYIIYVKNELEKKYKNEGDSLLSSYNDDDKGEIYDTNWAEIF